jgi:hypothetical protein
MMTHETLVNVVSFIGSMCGVAALYRIGRRIGEAHIAKSEQEESPEDRDSRGDGEPESGGGDNR